MNTLVNKEAIDVACDRLAHYPYTTPTEWGANSFAEFPIYRGPENERVGERTGLKGLISSCG